MGINPRSLSGWVVDVTDDGLDLVEALVAPRIMEIEDKDSSAIDNKDPDDDDDDGAVIPVSLDETQRSPHCLSAGQLAFLQAFSSIMQNT